MPKFQPQWASIAMGLAILGAVWWFNRVDPLFVGLFAVVIIASGLLPGIIGRLVWGFGLVGLAALAYFYYGSAQWLIALVLLVLGALTLGRALAERSRLGQVEAESRDR